MHLEISNTISVSYTHLDVYKRQAELDGRKQELLARIAELTVEAISPEQVSQISGYLCLLYTSMT